MSGNGIIYRAKRATTAPKRAAEEATRPAAPFFLSPPLPDSVALASLPVLEASEPPEVPVGLVAPVPVASEPPEPAEVLEASPPLPPEPALVLLPEPELPEPPLLPPLPPLLPPLPELGVPVDSGVPTEVYKVVKLALITAAVSVSMW